jgi:hypothetical protein
LVIVLHQVFAFLFRVRVLHFGAASIAVEFLQRCAPRELQSALLVTKEDFHWDNVTH